MMKKGKNTLRLNNKELNEENLMESMKKLLDGSSTSYAILNDVILAVKKHQGTGLEINLVRGKILNIHIVPEGTLSI